MPKKSAKRYGEKGGEFPAPPNEYWSVKIDLYGWFWHLYKFSLLRMEKVPNRNGKPGSSGVFVFERTPELEEAVREFWNPTTEVNKGYKAFLEALKDGRHMKIALER